MSTNEGQWFEGLKAGDNQTLKLIYKKYEVQFIKWSIKKYKIDDEAAEDVFQNAIIILYENVRSGKLSQLTSSLGTYLFGIGDNLIKGLLRKQNLRVSLEDFKELEVIDEVMVGLVNAGKLEKLLSLIGDTCRKILKMTYYDKLKSEEIAAALGYNTSVAVRKYKHDCLTKLKNIVRENSLNIEQFLE